MKIEIPETRGAKPKYNFDNIEVGETRSFKDVSTHTLLGCAKGYAKYRELDWKFRCYTMDGFTHVVRVA